MDQSNDNTELHQDKVDPEGMKAVNGIKIKLKVRRFEWHLTRTINTFDASKEKKTINQIMDQSSNNTELHQDRVDPEGAEPKKKAKVTKARDTSKL